MKCGVPFFTLSYYGVNVHASRPFLDIIKCSALDVPLPLLLSSFRRRMSFSSAHWPLHGLNERLKRNVFFF